MKRMVEAMRGEKRKETRNEHEFDESTNDEIDMNEIK